MKLRPDLLLHPKIPPPLHSLAPRNVLGKKWWDVTRKAANEAQGDKCAVCGVHKSKAWYRKYLEGHESYNIDYDNHVVTLKEVVGLCHSCHNYIHVGRLIKQYQDEVVSEQYVKNVLNWGIQKLSIAGLKPQATQAYHWLILFKNYSPSEAKQYVIEKGLEEEKFNPDSWDLWKIVIDGKDYTGLTRAEWIEKYA